MFSINFSRYERHSRQVTWRQTTLLAVALSIPLIGTGTFAHAQETGFADDFTSDSITFTAGSYNDATGESTITETPEGLRINVDQEQVDGYHNWILYTRKAGDKTGIEFTHLSDGTVSQAGAAVARVQANLYSETSPDDPAYFDGVGVVEGQIRFSYNGVGEMDLNYCLSRTAADGNSENVNNICSSFPGIVPELDKRYAMSVELNRDARTVTFKVDEQEQTFPIITEVHPTPWHNREAQLWIQGAGNATGVLHSVTLDDETIDTGANPPVYGRYTFCCEREAEGQSHKIVDNHLRLETISSTDDSYNGYSINIIEPTSYLESTITLSSETVMAEQSRVSGSLAMSLYNDQADGGVDGFTGDVYADFTTRIEANGQRSVEYCLAKSLDSDRNERENLLDNGRHCDILAVAPDFDKPLRMSIGLDKDAQTVTFRAGDQQHVQAVEGPFFTAFEQYASVNVSGRNGGNPVLLIDSIRTAEDAVTATEEVAGTGATPFPESLEPAIADSTLSYPVSNKQTSLDFIDDFSASTTDYSFRYDEIRGEAGVAVKDGRVILESTLIDPENCCAQSVIDVSEINHYLAARVSLSSDTTLPISDDARAQARIAGRFYNDTMDGGFDGRTGDVYIQNRIQLYGDGRRRAQVCLDREIEGTRSESVNIFDGNNCITFETIPELDVIYELSIRINRSDNTLIVGIDDELITATINTGIFDAAAPFRSVEINHEGESGKGVASVYGVSTATGSDDFSTAPPVFAPYRGLRDTQTAGVDAEVVDEQLRIELNGGMNDEEQTRFRYVSQSQSEYVSGTLSMSSDSVAGTGLYRIGVGGHMYNDIQNGGLPTEDGSNNANSEGSVYGSVTLVFNNNGEDYIQYCAWRADSSDWSMSTELISGIQDAERCLAMDTPAEFDRDYHMSVSLDRESNSIVYTVDDETKRYQIATGVHTPVNYWQGVSADAFDDSKLIAFADDLAFSTNPVPLKDSATLVGFVEPGTAVNSGTGAVSGNVGGGGAGGGCSLGSAGGLQAPLLLIAFMTLMRIRRRS